MLALGIVLQEHKYHVSITMQQIQMNRLHSQQRMELFIMFILHIMVHRLLRALSRSVALAQHLRRLPPLTQQMDVLALPLPLPEPR